MASLPAVWDTPITLPAQTFRRTGYTFRHWESSINGKTYPDEAQVTNLSGKTQDSRVTLYARWTPITYTVAFDARQRLRFHGTQNVYLRSGKGTPFLHPDRSRRTGICGLGP